MGITDNYTAFCVDEVALYLISKRQQGETPTLKTQQKEIQTPKDFLAFMGGG